MNAEHLHVVFARVAPRTQHVIVLIAVVHHSGRMHRKTQHRERVLGVKSEGKRVQAAKGHLRGSHRMHLVPPAMSGATCARCDLLGQLRRHLVCRV